MHFSIVVPNINYLSISWYATITSFIIITTYYYNKHKFSYWQKKGVRGPKPLPFIGNLHKIIFSSRPKIEKEWVKEYGKVYGLYQGNKPKLVIADPEILKQICIKDFEIFPNHHLSGLMNKYRELFLFNLQDDHWKRVRALMSPTFTSGRIKKMFKFFDACADDLVKSIEEQLPIEEDKNESKTSYSAIINAKELYNLFTMDTITTCCYGLKLERDGSKNLKTMASRNDFVNSCMKLFDFSILRLIIALIVPKKILIYFDYDEFIGKNDMMPLVKKVEELIRKRRAASVNKKFDDYLQLLIDARLDDKMDLNDMDLKENHHAGLTYESLLEDQRKMIDDIQKEKTTKVEMSDIEIISSAVFLLLVGLETTGTLLTSCTYMLAFHQDIQQKLYDELMKIAEFNKDKTKLSFDYEKLTSCQYLDAVISESLRIMPPLYYVDRISSYDYRIEKYNIDVPKNTLLDLAFYAIMNNEEFWPKPDKFIPDRFSPENKDKIVPGSYCPFGIGPRHCIGMRFSLTEAKLALAKIMLNFRFEPAPNTTFPAELKIHPFFNCIKNPKVSIICRNT